MLIDKSNSVDYLLKRNSWKKLVILSSWINETAIVGKSNWILFIIIYISLIESLCMVGSTGGHITFNTLV